MMHLTLVKLGVFCISAKSGLLQKPRRSCISKCKSFILIDVLGGDVSRFRPEQTIEELIMAAKKKAKKATKKKATKKKKKK